MLFPPILDQQCDAAGKVRLTLALAPELTGFDGHFPGCPLLPGVVQVHWAVHFARRHFAIAGAFSRLEQLKFVDLAVPGQTLVLQLAWDATAGSLAFEYRNGAGKVSAGRVRWA